MSEDPTCYNPNCTLIRGHADRCNGPVQRDCRHGRLARSCAECEDYEEIARLTDALRAADSRGWSAEIDRLTKERDEARTTINLVREMVEEMREDATRPTGGQSVSPRRNRVPLSIVHELQGLLGPEQAAYTHKGWLEAMAERDAERARGDRMAEALRGLLEAHGDGCEDDSEPGTCCSACALAMSELAAPSPDAAKEQTP